MSERHEMSDRELLIRIDERLETVQGRVSDHSNRIRFLEGVTKWAAGIGSGIAAIWIGLKLHVSVKQGP